MKVSTLFTVLFVAWLTAPQMDASGAEKAKRPPEGPLLTISSPHPTQYELALDEVELDWSRVPDAKRLAPAASANLIAQSKLKESQDIRAVVAVPRGTALTDMNSTATALRAANPGTEAYLVLYEPGRPKSEATRRLLTREVGLVMQAGEDPQQAIAGLAVVTLRPVAGVADGYVVDAADPMAALDLAEALRQRPGVRSAYPLLRRQHIKR